MIDDIMDELLMTNEKNFSALQMCALAKQKPDRDAKRERESITKAIYNEAMNGKYEYRRNHLHPRNVEYLKEQGFTVLHSDDTYFIKWGDT